MLWGYFCACYNNESVQILVFTPFFQMTSQSWVGVRFRVHLSKIFDLLDFYQSWFIHSFIVFSFLNYRSQTEGISSHRKHNPFKSKVIMILYALLSCIMRATGLVIYVVLTLGLLNVLRHLQGSQDTILWIMYIFRNFWPKENQHLFVNEIFFSLKV